MLEMNWDNNSAQGRSHKFVSEGDKTGNGERSPPAGSRGMSPGGGLGAKPREAEDIYANDHCNRPNVLTKKPLIFFSMGISGGTCSPCPPSLRHCSAASINASSQIVTV